MSFGLGGLGSDFGKLGAGGARRGSPVVPGVLSAARGSFVLTGNDAGLVYGRLPLTAAVGSFALSGQAAILTVQRTLAAGAGAFTLTGNDAALTKATPGAYTLAAGSGAFIFSGDTMTPLVDYRLPADVGAFTFTGQAVGPVAARKLPAAAGSFTFTGQDATLTKSGSDAAQTTAFLARTSGLDATHIAAYKALINGLVADGVFSKFDALYVTATQDLVTARLNLVSSSFPLVNVGAGVTFVADRGTTAAGGGLSTQFTPSTAGGVYALDSAHIMVWSNTIGDSTGGEFGTAASSNAFFITNSAVTGSQWRLNAGGGLNENTSSGYGFYLASRTASSNVNHYWGASSTLTTLSASSTASTNLPNDILSINGVSGFSSSNKEVSAASMGLQLSGADAAAFYSRLQAYMTAVGN